MCKIQLPVLFFDSFIGKHKNKEWNIEIYNIMCKEIETKTFLKGETRTGSPRLFAYLFYLERSGYRIFSMHGGLKPRGQQLRTFLVLSTCFSLL